VSNPNSATTTPAADPHQPDVLAGVLSYLVPGLGQIYQGRVGKGVLFLVCLYALFFTGMYLGSGKNVYIPSIATGADQGYRNNPWHLPLAAADVYNRLQFAGQFWIGVAAWPAIYQYMTYKPNEEPGTSMLSGFQRQPDETELNRLQSNGDKSWDLAWVYTVIASVLNILVIYDAFAGPTFSGESKETVAPQEAAA
jgi:TM2 domain-containing membrane protein YozV